MVRPEPRHALALFASLALLSCKEAEQPLTSHKARALPKSGAVWGRDLAEGLGLQEWELCQELGRIDCVADAHLITLGGVEPEELGIDQPLDEASVSAPMAVERVATAACGERMARDEAGPAVIFGPILDPRGGPAVYPARRAAVAEQLIIRLLGRRPTAAELRGFEALAADIEAVSPQPLRDWGVGACVVIATSTEALFY